MTKMTCHELIDFLSDYLDGALPSETVAVFDHHLSICPDCMSYLDNFRATLRATKSAFAPDAAATTVPEELVQAILASRGQ